MKIFTKNKIWSKLIIVFVLLSTVSFAHPKTVQAGDGGSLLKPIGNLVLAIGDGLVDIEHSLIYNQDNTLITIQREKDKSKSVWKVVFGVIAAVIIIALTYVFAPVLAAKLTVFALKAVIGITIAIAIVEHIPVAASFINTAFFNDEINLPLYSITPETILQGKIPLFNVNFFNPPDDAVKIDEKYGEDSATTRKATSLNSLSEDQQKKVVGALSLEVLNKKWVCSEKKDRPLDINNKYFLGSEKNTEEYYAYLTTNHGVVVSKELLGPGEEWVNSEGRPQYAKIYFTDQYVYMVVGWPDGGSKVYCVKVENTYMEGVKIENEGTVYLSYELQDTVATWYYRLRLVAIVGMMSVLVYIGIRIVLSSTSSSQKAKYKQLLWDWIVGMILLFTMEYIMVFANEFTDKLTKIMNSVTQPVYLDFMNKEDGNFKIEEEILKYQDETGESLQEAGILTYPEDDDSALIWRNTLMGHIRLLCDMNKYESTGLTYVGYTIMFLVMVIYVIVFTFTYIKRVIYLAFLTIISPLVALTYPIDKANDGKAQGFDFWFKEYIFNLLLQPMHLLLYTLLVSCAIQLAEKNIVYSLVAIGFIGTAEKLVRQMFNFSKAHTPGAFGGPAGAALTMTGMRWLFGHGPHGPGGKGGNGRGDDKKSDDENYSTGKKTIKEQLGGITLNPGDGGSNSEDEGATPEQNNRIREEDVLDSNALMSDIDGKGQNRNNRTRTESVQSRNNRIKYEDVLNSNELMNEINEDNNSGTRNAGNNGRSAGSNEQENKKKAKHGLLTAIGNASGYYRAGMKRKFSRNIKNAHPVRKLARMGAGAIGTAAFGSIGLAAGLIEGNPMKAAQYTGLGAIGGYKLGNDIARGAGDTFSVHGTSEAFERGFLGDEEYNNKDVEKNQKEYAHREETIKAIQERMGYSRKDAIEAAENWAPIYMNEGINNPADWVALEKFIDKGDYQNVEGYENIKDKDGNVRKLEAKEAIQLKRINDRYNISDKLGKQKREDTINKIKEDFGINDDTARLWYHLANSWNNFSKAKG